MPINCKAKKLLVNWDNTLWPCCWVCTQKDMSSYLKELPKDWNNLNKHSVNDILKHEAFKKHFNDEHWNNENKVDVICKTECDDGR